MYCVPLVSNIIQGTRVTICVSGLYDADENEKSLYVPAAFIEIVPYVNEFGPVNDIVTSDVTPLKDAWIVPVK